LSGLNVFGTSRAEKWSGRCAGLDLGATRDLSTQVVVWEDGDGVFHEKPYCWLPGDVKERSERDHTAFMPIGPTTDPKAIAYKIAEING